MRHAGGQAYEELGNQAFRQTVTRTGMEGLTLHDVKRADGSQACRHACMQTSPKQALENRKPTS